MAITSSTLKTGIRSFLEDLGTQIATKALADVPVIGDLNLPVGSLLFGLLMDEIDDALDAAGAGIDGLVAALDGIEGIEASLDGGDLSVRFSANESLDLIDEDFGIGGFVGGVGLEIDGAFQTTLSAELDASLRIDDEFGEVFLVDVAGVKEVTVSLESHLSVDAEGKLGFLDIAAVDHDPDAPELSLSASFDLPAGRAADAFAGPLTPDFTGTAGIDLDLVASLANGALPEISTNFVIEFDLEGGSPKIAFNDISIDLSSILGIFGGLFGTISDVLNSGPLGTILDLITGPLPVIDSAAEDSGFDGELDTLPELIKDGDISLADLFVKFADSGIAGDQYAQISDYLKKVSLLDLVRDLAADLDADGAVNVGSFSIGDDPLEAITNFTGVDPAQLLADFNQAILDTGIFDELPDLTGGFTDEVGVTVPLFDNPSLVVNILFNQLFDPVTIIQLDLPKFELPAQVDLFFPIIGPIGLGLKAGVNASVDLSFGFDTAGIATGNFLDALYAGLYIATTDEEGTPVPDKIAAEIDAVLKGYAGVDIGIASLKIGGGLNLLVEAYLRDPDNDGKTRLADVGDCFLDPLTGRAWADLEVVGKIGIGPFSASKTITIAKAEFADFNYTVCEPAVSPIDRGLARIVEGAETDLLLHTGALANLREIGKDTGGPISYIIGDDLFVPEYYQIGNAVDEETGAKLPGVLAVSAFGAYQVFGSADAPVERITGDLGALADSLIVASDVLQAVVVGAGAGNDFVIGGGGNDEISGASGEDQLQGGAGDDMLDGGADDDTLYGGAGADRIVGGSGFDDVSYEAANAGTGVGVRFYRDSFGSVVGFGGEAEGDRLEGIEQITGTAFDDELTTGDAFTGFQFAGKTLFGLRGNDKLIGGFGDDFLLGGEGGDLLAGGFGRDATSYVFSRDAVVIDLSTGTAYGGEATGDVLTGIEVVQGSIFADTLIGDAANNDFDGSGGDDVLEGGAGADILYGNVGDDTIFGGADGDTLDGSLETPERTTTDTGTDLLSYSRVEGSGVTVSLLEGFAQRNGFSLIRDRIVSEGRYLDIGGVTYTLLPGDSTFENLIGTSDFGDILTGDIDRNRIEGLGGADRIDGGAGDDRLVGGSGADRLIGGTGIDWAEYGDSDQGVTVNLSGPAGVGGTAEGDVVTGVENLLGSDFLDNLNGDDADNIIDPGLGGTFEFENVNGSGGTDTIVVDYSRGDVGGGITGGFEFATGGFLRRFDANGIDQIDGVIFLNTERLRVTGTMRDDTIRGGNGADVIATGAGNDTILSGLGADVVDAGDGDDSVTYGSTFGGGLSDASGAGPFLLKGGRGIDTLSISVAGLSEDVVIAGSATGTEFSGVNLAGLLSGAAVTEFEILGEVRTGSGDDSVTQLGTYDNVFATGDGSDTIRSGLGIDSVNGGADTTGLERVDPIASSSNPRPIYRIADLDTFVAAGGDRLVLDYSGLETEAVLSLSFRVGADLPDGLRSTVPLSTSEGTYFTRSNAAPDVTIDQVFFTAIEHLDVTGSRFGDLLVGTDIDASYNGNTRIDTARGSDILRGMDGDDTLVGYSGNDRLFGGAGDDFVQGSIRPRSVRIDGGGTVDASSQAEFGDRSEVDLVTGGDGADTFVIGDATASHYVDGLADASDRVVSSRAIITDYDRAEGDVVRLHGSPNEYQTIVFEDDTYIVKYVTEADNYGTFVAVKGDGRFDIVAVVEGVTDFSLYGDGVAYVAPVIDGPPPVQPAVPVLTLAAFQALLAREPGLSTLPNDVTEREADDASGADTARAVPSASVAAASPSAPANLAAVTAATGWVTQDSREDVLLAALGSGSGIVAGSASLSIEGSSEGFGTFDGDPFGLGSGVVLSTGRVADLDAPNSSSGLVGSASNSVPLTFVKIGRAGETDIYRADLSGLGIDLNSLRLTDGNTKFGGEGGTASGFELDAVALSTTRLDTVLPGTDLDDPSLLPRLDAFALDSAHLFLSPGTQRPQTQPGLIGPNLIGSIDTGSGTALLINPAARLGGFSPIGNTGNLLEAVTLGDGGSLGINLKQTVSTDGPLYLYIGEYGGSGEAIIGSIEASSDLIVPAGDLSTDLGAPGLPGDASRMTYRFTPIAGTDLVSFEVVIFSEELPEHAGIDPADIVEVTLNGVSIAALSDGAAATLGNLMFNPAYAGHPDLVLNPVGTGPLATSVAADGYTRTLTFVGRVEAGQTNTLVVEVADTRDAYLDTGILVKGGTFLSSAGALPDNIAPFAVGELVSTDRNTPVSGNVLANDVDPDGDALTARLSTGPGHGTVVFGEDGRFAYTPDAGFSGADSFRYTANDGAATSSLATVTILVAPGAPNAAPTDIALSNAAVAEDAAAGTAVGTLSALDPDGDPVTFSLAAGSPFVLDGTVLKVASPLDFETTPTVTVTVTADDGAGGTRTESFDIAIGDVAEVPPAILDFTLAKTAVAPGTPETTWRNPLTNLVYAFADGGYSGPSSPVGDPTGPELARFSSDDGDVIVSRAEFDAASAVDGIGGAPALVLDWEGQAAVLRLETPWNSIKNVRLDAFTGTTLSVVNFVDVAADWSAAEDDRDLTLDGSKRGQIVFGGGDDSLTILANTNGAGFSNLFDISTGAGDDMVVIRRSALDYAGLALGTTDDPTLTTSLVDLGEGDDVFYGGAGIDEVFGRAGADRLRGGGGDDRLFGEAGADNIDGGDGSDLVLAGFGADVLNGGAGDDRVLGEGDDDYLFGGLGNDRLEGGDGADTIDGADGADFLDGGAGNDVLTGKAGADFLGGGEGDDTVLGGAGNDDLTGGAGRDILWGDAGNDTLSGGEGADVLRGGDGLDRLFGGLGRDLSYGGAGNDVFEFRSVADSGIGATLRDRIFDWDMGDRIDLRQIDADIGTAVSNGNASFNFIGQAAFGAAGQIRFVEAPGGHTVIQANLDLDFETVEFEIELNGTRVALSADDFLL